MRARKIAVIDALIPQGLAPTDAAAGTPRIPARCAGRSSAFLTKITRVKDGTGTVDLVTDLAYHSTGYLASIRDEGGTFRRFTYDAHGRLSEVRNHGSVLVEAYAYEYSRTSANGWVYQASAPNRITTTTYLSGTATVEAREYLDGLGPADPDERAGREHVPRDGHAVRPDGPSRRASSTTRARPRAPGPRSGTATCMVPRRTTR